MGGTVVQTNSTLSQLSNRVLTEAGERAQASISTPSAAKAVNALKDTFIEISNSTDWSWTQQRVQADTWTDEKATFTNGFQRCHDVSYTMEDGRERFLQAIDRKNFYTSTITGYDGYDPGRNSYHVSDYGEVSISCYPTSATEQAKYTFTLTVDPQLPSTSSGTFAMPPRFETVLVKGATARFVNLQFSDDNRYRVFQREYELLLRQHIQRERSNNSTRNPNFFNNLRTQRYYYNARY